MGHPEPFSDSSSHMAIISIFLFCSLNLYFEQSRDSITIKLELTFNFIVAFSFFVVRFDPVLKAQVAIQLRECPMVEMESCSKGQLMLNIQPTVVHLPKSCLYMVFNSNVQIAPIE